MKHAIMIMAHKNVKQLVHLIEYFSHDCYVFIHLDKKFHISCIEKKQIKTFPQVKGLYQNFNVSWGGFSILKCELFLMRKVLEYCDAEYMHLISGQDYPSMPLDDFLFFFDKYKSKDCLQYVHLPHVNWEHNTLRRFQYFYPYDWFSNRNIAVEKVGKIVSLQQRFGLRRVLPNIFDHLYGNSQWFSITRDSTQLLINYTHKHPILYWKMMMTFAPEESYISTVLVNLKQGKDILFTNFRYICWKYVNGNCPANLDARYFRAIIESECVFVRKIEMPISSELIALLDKYFVYDKQPLVITSNGGWVYDGYRAYDYNRLFSEALINICTNACIDSVLDVGCGTGIYVAELRGRNVAASGFDVNPYTEELSRRLFDPGQDPCVQADLLDDDLQVESPFTMVVCKEVLPYIPTESLCVAINHLASFTSEYILLSWYENKFRNGHNIHVYSEYDIDNLMSDKGFVPEKILNRNLAKVQSLTNKYKIYRKHD